MGNCVSASGIIAPKIRVVQASEGRVLDMELPPLQSRMTVGELLLEFPPGHFITQINGPHLLASTSPMRATPLAADIDAKPGVVYVLFPMLRLHSRITPQELLSIEKLLHLQDQQLTRVKVHVHRLATVGARVAPVIDQQCKEAVLHRDADTKEQAICPSPSIFTKQVSEEETMAYADSSISCILSPFYGPIGMNKPRPWAPKLQTIMESL